MGCCLSTLEPNKSKPNSIDKTQPFSCVSKSPPRPEEESVKEVLSETPNPKLKPELELEPEPTIKLPKINPQVPTKPRLVVSPKKPLLEQKLPSLEQKLSFLEKKLPTSEQKYDPDPITPEEISEVSEMCSLSETMSTNTLDEQQKQHQSAVKDSATSGEIRQRVYRSQGHNSNLHNNHSGNLRNHGRSPVRRADPSPPRKRYPGQVGPRREMVGENSARRSRSPATRGNVGRSPSGRRNGPSPGRVRMVNGPENVRKVDESDKNVGLSRDGNENEREGPNESLENPLVSLECFIFL